MVACKLLTAAMMASKLLTVMSVVTGELRAVVTMLIVRPGGAGGAMTVVTVSHLCSIATAPLAASTRAGTGTASVRWAAVHHGLQFSPGVAIHTVFGIGFGRGVCCLGRGIF